MIACDCRYCRARQQLAYKREHAIRLLKGRPGVLSLCVRDTSGESVYVDVKADDVNGLREAIERIDEDIETLTRQAARARHGRRRRTVSSLMRGHRGPTL